MPAVGSVFGTLLVRPRAPNNHTRPHARQEGPPVHHDARFVCPGDDPDREPETRSLLISAVTFRKALGLAETRKWYRAPRRHFLPVQTDEFARALREALSERVEVKAGPRGSSRFTPTCQLREYFEQPAQKRALEKLMSFLAGGGAMDVNDE